MELKNKIKGCDKKNNRRVTQAIQGGFESWFNNHMTPTVGAIQRVKPRAEEQISKIVSFLHALQSHFTILVSPEALEDAYDYLWWYFKAYPQVSEENSKEALQMIDRIYEVLGLSRLAPIVTFKAQKSCIPQMLKEVVQAPSSILKGCLLHAQRQLQAFELACESYFHPHGMIGGRA